MLTLRIGHTYTCETVPLPPDQCHGMQYCFHVLPVWAADVPCLPLVLSSFHSFGITCPTPESCHLCLRVSSCLVSQPHSLCWAFCICLPSFSSFPNLESMAISTVNLTDTAYWFFTFAFVAWPLVSRPVLLNPSLPFLESIELSMIIVRYCKWCFFK